MNKDIILYLRQKNKLTQRDFAKVVSCSYSLIALVELGKRNITTSLETKIKQAFDLDDTQIETLAKFASDLGKSMTTPYM